MNVGLRNWVVALVLLAVLWVSREWMQAHMARHMLLQMPMLAWVGWLFHTCLGGSTEERIKPWNREGLSGFILFQCLTAFWMVPRAIDLALTSPTTAAIKATGWILAGFLLRQSMRQSHPAVQFFMFGNFAMMTAAVSDIYEHAPNRLCNAYRTNDQVVVAHGLVLMLVAMLVVWTLYTWRVSHNKLRHGNYPKLSTL